MTGRLALAVLLSVPAVLSACGGSSLSGPDGQSAGFTAAIDGSLTVRLRGEAVYVFHSGLDPVSAELSLFSLDHNTPFQIHFNHAGAPLVAGTYAIAENGETRGAVLDSQQGALRAFVFDGGTLTVTSASGSAVAGSFSVTAYENSDGVMSNRVTVTGSFTAIVMTP